jgi:hypothetical protein
MMPLEINCTQKDLLKTRSLHERTGLFSKYGGDQND